MNRVLNFRHSEKVFFNSLNASFADWLIPRLSISFSISGSGTYLNVNIAKPSHHAPEDAITKGISQLGFDPAPSTMNVIIIRWMNSNTPPPK